MIKGLKNGAYISVQELDLELYNKFNIEIVEAYVEVGPSSGKDKRPLIPPQALWPMTTMYSTCCRQNNLREFNSLYDLHKTYD